MNSPLVSIIIPVYNREHIIAETVKCATDQTYQNIEIIISDNFSTDGTLKILNELKESDNRIKVFQTKENLGPVLNWKNCIDHASGEYLKILWSDDKISKNFISLSLDALTEDVAFVISPVEIFDHESGKVLEIVNYDGLEEFSTECFLFNMLIHNKYNFMVSPGCGFFRFEDVKRSLYLDIPNGDGLDFKQYGAGNDLLIFLFTSLNYPKIKINTDSQSFFRSHQNSISVEKKYEIHLYYQWSKQFFINNFYPQVSNAFKSKLLLKVLFDKKMKTLYLNNNGKVSLKELILAAFRKLIFKE